MPAFLIAFSGSEGYDVDNVSIPAGGFVTLFTLTPGADLDVYLRVIAGGSDLTICTDDAVAACTAGYNLPFATTYKGLVSGMSLDINKSRLIATNDSADALILRAGKKLE